jgi:hypothetical protein
MALCFLFFFQICFQIVLNRTTTASKMIYETFIIVFYDVFFKFKRRKKEAIYQLCVFIASALKT